MTAPRTPNRDAGDAPPARHAPLPRAPGQRYARAAAPVTDGASSPPWRAWILVAAVVLGGAGVVALLGLVDVSLGLLAVGVALGWIVGVAVRAALPAAPVQRRVLSGLVTGDATVALGLLLTWLWSLTEGGVLGPVPYAIERYGLLGLLLLVVTGSVAAVRSR